MYQIAIIDDHRVLLDGLCKMLLDIDLVSHVDAYNKVQDFLDDQKSGKRHHLLITDLQMPEIGGVELISLLKRQKSDLRILVMSMLDTPDLIHSLLNLGISGYFLKGNSSEVLAEGVVKILRDEAFFSKEIRDVVISYYEGDKDPLLSKRELQIAQLIGRGKTGKDISDELGVSVFTVQTHRKNMFRKLEVHNTAEMLKALANKGLV